MPLVLIIVVLFLFLRSPVVPSNVATQSTTAANTAGQQSATNQSTFNNVLAAFTAALNGITSVTKTETPKQ